jgi:hypothetical protein
MEFQQNWRLDEQGAPVAASYRSKQFRFEQRDGQRMRILVAKDGYALDAAEQALSATPAAASQAQPVLEAPGREAFAVHDESGNLLEAGYTLLLAERGMMEGSRVTYRYHRGQLAAIEILFATRLASGEVYRGRQLTTFSSPRVEED